MGFLRLLLEPDRMPVSLSIRPGLTLVCSHCHRADKVQQRWHTNRFLRALQWGEMFCPRCKRGWIHWHGLEQVTGFAFRLHQPKRAHIKGLSVAQEMEIVRLAAQYRTNRDQGEVEPFTSPSPFKAGRQDGTCAPASTEAIEEGKA